MQQRYHYTDASFQDWPGRVALVVWLEGCNLRCPFCHNSHLVLDRGAGPASCALDEVMSALAAQTGLVDGVVISGGEPLRNTLQLDELLTALRGGFAHLPIKLDTNGTYPGSLRDVLDRDAGGPRSIRRVSLDVKSAPENYDLATGSSLDGGLHLPDCVERSVQAVVAAPGVELELRTTVVEGLNGEDGRSIAQWLSPYAPSVACYCVQRFRPGTCIDPVLDTCAPTSDETLARFAGELRAGGFAVRGTSGVG